MTAWDFFVDYCTENGLDPEVEDFDAWKDEQAERFAEKQAEMDWLYSREN